MNALTVALTLKTPILLTSVANGDENSARTLDYIPGGTLRGLLISRYMVEKNISSDALLADETAHRLFFSCEVKYLNAYPTDSNNKRYLPAPVSLRQEKGDEGKGLIYDFAFTKKEGQTEKYKYLFCLPDGNELTGINPDKTMSVHIGGETRGRVKKGESTVFKYQALEAGQKFQAIILASSDDLKILHSLLPNGEILNLGGSRSAGYGQATVKCGELSDWQESESQSMEDDEVILTLLSDALLKNKSGQQTLDLDQALSVQVGRDIHGRAFHNTTLVGGFNRRWSLPLPLMPALGMGSVWVYPAKTFTDSELEKIQREGIGERRNEGFGRVAVNWLNKGEWGRGNPSTSQTLRPQGLSNNSKEQAQRMVGNLLHMKLDSELRARMEQENSDLKLKHSSLRNHQISRLRLVVRDLLADSTKEPKTGIDTFFNDLKSTSKDAFEKARLMGKNERFVSWVKDRAEKLDGIEIIGRPITAKIAGQQANIDDPIIKREYTLRLVEAVLYRAMKDNKKQDNNRSGGEQ